MTITVETGAIVSGSNSFVTSAELDDYLSDRAYTAMTNQEPMLIRAYDFMKCLPWCVSHSEAFMVTNDMKNAQCEIAYRINTGFDMSATQTGGKIKRQKVDVIEQEFFGSSTITSPESALRRMPQAFALLDNLLCGGGGFTLELA